MTFQRLTMAGAKTVVDNDKGIAGTINKITRLEMTKRRGDDVTSRDQPISWVQLFNVLLHILGQICRFVLGKNAQQWAQLQPPALRRYTMSTITQSVVL